MPERICLTYGRSCDRSLDTHNDGTVGLVIPLDGIDVEALEGWVGSHAGLARLAYDNPDRAFFNQVTKILRALDQEDTP